MRKINQNDIECLSDLLGNNYSMEKYDPLKYFWLYQDGYVETDDEEKVLFLTSKGHLALSSWNTRHEA